MNQVKQFDEIPERILNGPVADYFQAGRANLVKCTREQLNQVVSINDVKNYDGTENFIIIDNTITGGSLEIYLFILTE